MEKDLLLFRMSEKKFFLSLYCQAYSMLLVTFLKSQLTWLDVNLLLTRMSEKKFIFSILSSQSHVAGV